MKNFGILTFCGDINGWEYCASSMGRIERTEENAIAFLKDWCSSEFNTIDALVALEHSDNENEPVICFYWNHKTRDLSEYYLSL